MSLVVWAISGVFSVIGALCYVELGLTIQASGAEYTYIKKAFGDLPAFLVLWIILTISGPTGFIIVSITCAQYVIQPLFPDCPIPDEFVRIGACLVMSK